MQVDQVIALLDDLFGNQIRSAVGLGPVHLARIKAVHALLINRIYVGNFLFERLNVDERNDDYSSRNLGGIEQADHLLERNDRSVFSSM
jgi:hypothetical protein